MIIDFVKKYLFLIFFFVSVVIFLAHTIYTKTAVFSDANYYYTYTHSIVKDFDLNFTNEYQNLKASGPKNNIGYPVNFYPPGVSVFWIPGFLFADLFAKSIDLFIPNLINTNGYGFFYQFFVGATSTVLGVFGLYLTYQLLKDYFSDLVSLISTTSLFLTTNLFFYVAVEPINSHAVSFFVASFFVYYFFKHEKDKYYYLRLGVIGGIAGLVRTQDLLILIIPVMGLVFKRKIKISSLTTHLSQLTTGFIIGFLPQMFVWKFFYNTFWHSPYLNNGFNFLKPHIVHVLFNTQNGLITLTPSILVAFVGLLISSRKLRFSIYYAVVYFILSLYMISAWSFYTQGGSYSIRMIISTYPLLAFGFAEIIKRLYTKSKNLTYFFLFLFTYYNIFSIIHYLLSF